MGRGRLHLPATAASMATMPKEMQDAQKQLQGEVEAYKTAQAENQKLMAQSTQLSSQISENQMVEKELKLLEEDANVYKLVGPVLIPQDLLEAKANVAKRLEFMQGEKSKIESKMKENNELSEKVSAKVMAFQQKMQKMAQEAGAAAAAAK